MTLTITRVIVATTLATLSSGSALAAARTNTRPQALPALPITQERMAVGLATAPPAVTGFTIDTQFRGIDLAQDNTLGSSATPPDMAAAASPAYVAQLVNGGFAVFTRTGGLVGTVVTDLQFWKNAGASAALLKDGVYDPRMYYDAASGRFFVTQATGTSPSATAPKAHEAFLVGISKTSNPADGFTVVSVPLKPGVSADFPTLGVNADAVTVSAENFYFDGTINTSIASIPKADLLTAKPSVARLSRFDSLAESDNGKIVGYGSSVHAVDSQNPSNGTQALFGIGVGLNAVPTASLTNAGTKAKLSSAQSVYTQFDGHPAEAREPKGTYNTVDNRITGDVRQVGNLIYFARTVSDDKGGTKPMSDYVVWSVVDATTRKIVSEGRIIDPARKIDYSTASIDANANGTFVIGYNGSSKTIPISAYATVCTFSSPIGTASCGAPQLLAKGLAGDYNAGSPTRWGDYSVTQVDPTNAKAFWLYQEIPDTKQGNSSRWATIITRIVTP